MLQVFHFYPAQIAILIIYLVLIDLVEIHLLFKYGLTH